MSNDPNFELLSSIYDEMVFQDHYRHGELFIKNETVLENLKICLADVHTFGLSTLIDIDELKVNDKILLDRGEPLPRIGHFNINFKDFLANINLVKFPKKNFYFLEDKLSSLNPDIENIEYFKRYKAILEFINEVLIPSAVYFDKDFQTLIYLSDRKIEIPIKYNFEDLMSLNIDLILKIREYFFEDTHKEQKLSIISESVKNIGSGVSKNFRFKHILENLSDLKKSFDNGYKLFVASFSYEKIKDETESAKIEEMTKIYKVISDVQNHILGIPIATVVVGTQMKIVANSTGQLVINTCILLGALFFTLLVSFVMNNQKDTLNIIKLEIDRKKDLIEKKYASVEEIIKPDFKNLYKRIEFQGIVLCAVILVVWLGFIATVVAYFILSFN
ncbi:MULTISPECIES: hypothetical protein [Acinetobacter]|uniref:hypothetical protein n=1 Tax=Acinetobacter TaxID=469 RepID=UPI00029C9760|nr:hypothetical protein [Acinetobacter sp. WC-141]EKU37489.1 hypothetical protein ACINWC141_3605 [Acinetobacter sp. WC-141]